MRENRTHGLMREGRREPVLDKNATLLARYAGQPRTDIALSAVVRSELLTGALFDLMDRRYNVGARSLSRAQLERILVGERGMPEDLWRRVARVLEFGEMVRFASSAGAVGESVARQELSKWVEESMEVERELG